MTPEECFVDYLAVKAHFAGGSYDYFRYGGKVRSKPGNLEKRRDRYFFAKISKRSDAHERIVTGILTGLSFIGDVASKGDDWPEHYERMRRVESLSYLAARETASLGVGINELVRPKHEGSHPLLLREYLGGRVSLETLTAVLACVDGYALWSRMAAGDPVWEGVTVLSSRYLPFLRADIEKLRRALAPVFLSVSADKAVPRSSESS